MSSIWIDGFDGYAQTSDLGFRYANNGASLITNGGRWGGGAISLSGLTPAINAPLYDSPTEIWSGFSIKSSSTGNQDVVLASWISPNGLETSLTYNPLTLVFKLYARLNTAVVLATSSPVLLSTTVWHYIDLHMKISSTVGLCEVWVDNTRVLNAVNIDTAPFGGTSLVAMGLGGSGNFFSLNCVIDDWCARDANSGSVNIGRIGDSRVCTTVPNGDAGPNNGVPSTSGPHYAMVDEANWSASNTVTLTNTTGQAEQYTMSALPVTPVEIYAVQVVTFCEKTDGGAASAKQYVDSGGTTAYGPSQSPLDPFSAMQSIFETDPHTSTNWTETSVNAVQTGYQVQ